MGNNPVKYVDPDGRTTTVVIIHAKTFWENIVGGSHVAIHFSNPAKYDKYGDKLYPTLYNPSGHYEVTDYNGIIKKNLELYSNYPESSLVTYLKYTLNGDKGAYCNIYQIDTIPEQEKKMIELASELDRGFMACASNSSSVLSKVLKQFNIKVVSKPGKLEKQLEKLVSEGNAKKIVIKTYDDISKVEGVDFESYTK